MDAAANNIQRSMFDDVIRLKRVIFESDAPSEKGLLLVNPPYNVRIAANTHQFYRDMGDVLKKKYAGWTMWITSDM